MKILSKGGAGGGVSIDQMYERAGSHCNSIDVYFISFYYRTQCWLDAAQTHIYFLSSFFVSGGVQNEDPQDVNRLSYCAHMCVNTLAPLEVKGIVIALLKCGCCAAEDSDGVAWEGQLTRHSTYRLYSFARPANMRTTVWQAHLCVLPSLCTINFEFCWTWIRRSGRSL